MAIVHKVAKSQTQLSDFALTHKVLPFCCMCSMVGAALCHKPTVPISAAPRPVVKTPCFQCRGCMFYSWSGN